MFKGSRTRARRATMIVSGLFSFPLGPWNYSSHYDITILKLRPLRAIFTVNVLFGGARAGKMRNHTLLCHIILRL
jgi:hypothetical protein